MGIFGTHLGWQLVQHVLHYRQEVTSPLKLDSKKLGIISVAQADFVTIIPELWPRRIRVPSLCTLSVSQESGSHRRGNYKSAHPSRTYLPNRTHSRTSK